MCGICGVLNFDMDKYILSEEIKRMTDSLRHRGPDSEGFHLEKNLGLGFRRLSIIDLESGNQPISNEDDKIWSVFNGEIYNFLELKNSLISKGHTFRTDTDSEVLVHLYEEYGVKMLDYLRGMFSFVIWDSNRQKLFCARDRLGIKPFFYSLSQDRFVFGSEIKSILKSSSISKKISLSSLDSFFTYGYITGNKTIFKDIKKLLPGNALEIDMSSGYKLKIWPYWKLNFAPNHNKSEMQWKVELAELISESVKLRLISDVPLGAFLSGGIDSSSIVAMMATNSSKPVKTFSIGFRESKYNELTYAREVSKRYGTEHHEKILDPVSIDILPKIVKMYDEPFADSSAIPTFLVSEFAREFVTVALSGDGGDELFTGYNHYKRVDSISKYQINSKKTRDLIWGNLNKLIPESLVGQGLSYRLTKDPRILPAFVQLYYNQSQRRNLYREELFSKINTDIAENYKLKLLMSSTSKDILSKMQELDIKTYLVDDILTKVDRASMSNSLEVRVPFLDHKIVEHAATIPINLKYKNKNKKYILKETMKNYLPEKVLNHPKQGFAMPLDAWFKDDLKEFIYSKLILNDSKLYKYLDKDFVNKNLQTHFLGMRDYSQKIWMLLFLDEWLNQNT